MERALVSAPFCGDSSSGVKFSFPPSFSRDTVEIVVSIDRDTINEMKQDISNRGSIIIKIKYLIFFQYLGLKWEEKFC